MKNAFFGILAPCLLAGCGSTLPASRLDPSAYAELQCDELDAMVGSVSQELSRIAVTRGEVSRTTIPRWVIGGRRVASAVIDRQTARIGRLQEQGRVLAAARDRNCAEPPGLDAG